MLRQERWETPFVSARQLEHAPGAENFKVRGRILEKAARLRLDGHEDFERSCSPAGEILCPRPAEIRATL
jgi:hypothetical protein